MNTPGSHVIKYSFDEIYGDFKVGPYGGFGFSSIDTRSHRHNDYYEITFIVSGVYIHTYKGHNYNLTPGDLILMSPHSEHQLYTEPMQATFFAICIQEDFFLSCVKQHFPDFEEHVFSKCTVAHLDSTDFTYLEQLGRQLSNTRPSRYVADTLTYLTLVNIFHKNNPTLKNKSEPVQRILNLLNEPSLLHMPASRLYSTAGLSAPTFIKNFKEQTGYTIVEYKNKKRMEFAANMLRNTDKKVIDIAYELRFESLSYFLRTFKKEFGITPTEYRKNHK